MKFFSNSNFSWVSFDASNTGEKHRVVILLDNGYGLVLVLLLDLFGPALGGVHGEPACTELLWQASLLTSAQRSPLPVHSFQVLSLLG